MDLLSEELVYRVSGYVNTYHLTGVVETGLGHASSGLRFAELKGISGYGCDILETRVAEARLRHPSATIVHQHSTAFLREVVPALQGPVLFWLDAHEPDWPLYEELLILRDAPAGSVILCDDAHFILEGHPCLKGHTLGEYLTVLPTHSGTVIGELTSTLQPVLEYVPK